MIFSITKLKVAAFPVLQMFGLFVPYCAVISASGLNMCLSRYDEIKVGAPIFDADGVYCYQLKK